MMVIVGAPQNETPLLDYGSSMQYQFLKTLLYLYFIFINAIY